MKDIGDVVNDSEYIQRDKEFKRFIQERRYSYGVNVYNHYSVSELYEKGKDSSHYNTDEVCVKEMMSLLSVAPWLIVLANVDKFSHPTFMLYASFSLTIILFSYFMTPLSSRFIFKHWLKRNREVLMDYLLRKLEVGEEVKKRFVMAYGEEELAILMSNKRVLTCGDVFDYANRSKYMKEIKERRESLKAEFRSLA